VRVQVYRGASLVRTYTATPPSDPFQSGRDLWRVAELVVADGNVTIDDDGGQTLGYYYDDFTAL
jgi:hypothetical protein